MREAPPADVAVRVDNLSKAFRLPHEQVHTLKERVVHPTRRRRFERLEALRGVSFDVRRGECFGIVGRNGSGKSTLMKCLAGIYSADAGDIWLRGRMAPFIELGVGFNPELSARDNVLINAVMLGLTPAEARERYDRIIAFAELEEFVDLKLKNYSSGMQVRLAFAVMVHVDADVLLIDEVLAVGDAAFQSKCYDSLVQARAEGRTILLVTHDMNQVRRFCDRAILLERGDEVGAGEPGEVVRRYMEVNFPAGRARQVARVAGEGAAEGRATILETWAQDAEGMRTVALEQGRSCALCLRVRFLDAVGDPVVAFVVEDRRGQRVFVATTEWEETGLGAFVPGDVLGAAVSFDNWLAPGDYAVRPQLLERGGEPLALPEEPLRLAVAGERTGGGVVDIPHAFSFFRGGRTAKDEQAVG